MRVFKNPWSARFARKERIADATLCDAVARAEMNLMDADLGGGLIKQRISRPGAGKSGGYRTLVFYRSGSRAVFAVGFAKSDLGNIDAKDEVRLKTAAKLALGYSEAEIDRLV